MKISLPFYLTKDSTQKKSKKMVEIVKLYPMDPILGELEIKNYMKL